MIDSCQRLICWPAWGARVHTANICCRRLCSTGRDCQSAVRLSGVANFSSPVDRKSRRNGNSCGNGSKEMEARSWPIGRTANILDVLVLTSQACRAIGTPPVDPGGRVTYFAAAGDGPAGGAGQRD
jgi:hypothetical protein